MITPKSQLAQTTLAAMTFVLVLGTLAMIWPGVIALIFGIFLLIQSCVADEEIVMLSWVEISNLPIVFTALRRSSSPSILS